MKVINLRDVIWAGGVIFLMLVWRCDIPFFALTKHYFKFNLTKQQIL